MPIFWAVSAAPINVLGHYSFNIAEQITKGQLKISKQLFWKNWKPSAYVFVPLGLKP